MTSIDADGHRSDVLGILGDAMAGPLAAGARTEPVPINGHGRARLDAGLRLPLVLVAPVDDVGTAPLTVTARIGTTELPQVTFASFTERDAFLPLHLPDTGPDDLLAAPVELVLRAAVGGASVAVPRVKDIVRLVVLSGLFGRLHYLMASETPRIRRLIRQVSLARQLGDEGASGALLDRIGQELAVPRLSDRIRVVAGEIVTEDGREDDESYRRRLSIYRPFLMATRSRVETAINAGGSARFDVTEADNPFHIGLRLVSVAETTAAARQARLRYLEHLRAVWLVDPTTATPSERRLPQARRAAEDQMRLRLSTLLGFGGSSRAMAPALAAAFDRVGLAAMALSVPLSLSVSRAQQDDGGSRWELGLAAEVTSPTPSELSALATAAQAIDPDAITDRAQRSLVVRLRDTLPSGGPTAEWLFKAAGMRTVHALGPQRLMLSHMSTGGLVIEGISDLDQAGIPAGFTAAMLAENDSALNAALAYALAGGGSGWPGGSPPWRPIPDAGLAAAIAALALPPSALSNRVRALGLPADFDHEHFRMALAGYPVGMFALLQFTAAFSSALEAQQAAEWDRLGVLLETLAQNGASSAALMKRGAGRLILVVSAIALPLMPSNLAGRRSSGFVWRALPVNEGTWRVQGAGTRATFRAGTTGLAALAVVGYARRGLTDPFEYKVTGHSGTVLGIEEYEFLMNQLRHLTPVGVQANTWEIRRQHVALTAGAKPTPLPPSLTRAFRPFRRPRFAGADAPPAT